METADEIDRRSLLAGLLMYDGRSLMSALGGVYIVLKVGSAVLPIRGLGGFPGGRNWRLEGIGARPEDGVDGVLGRDPRRAEAGRGGGPIEPLLLVVLDRLLTGDGAGET